MAPLSMIMSNEFKHRVPECFFTKEDHFLQTAAGDDLLPVSFQKLLPRCLSTALRRWLDAVPLQNVRNRVVREYMPQIGKGALYPSVTPGSILLRHTHNQGSDCFSGWASSKFPRRTAIVFLGDQFSMPLQ